MLKFGLRERTDLGIPNGTKLVRIAQEIAHGLTILHCLGGDAYININADNGHVTKTANFQNPRWRTAAMLKIVKIVIHHYLSEKIIGF